MKVQPPDQPLQLHFLGIGPQRTASSWLDQVLRSHPQLSLPYQVKETFFFDERFDRGWEWYAWHFRNRKTGQYVGEVGPTYFDSETARERLHKYYPELKLIITVRNPVVRAFSLYRHHRTKGRVPGTFAEAIKRMPRILTSGKYGTHCPAWENCFGTSNVLYLVQEDIQSHPEAVFKQVCDFLGVETTLLPPVIREVYGAGTEPRFPALARRAAQAAIWVRDKRLHGVVEFGKKLGLKAIYRGGQGASCLTPEEQKFLQDYYRYDISWLEQRLNRDFSFWQI